eukprot:CAMPEP_0202758314 /NCGR_PEP_ID=MMETSP1388-20130828/16987_1 /ASSEMBLY_ACC=CAM_ASM_000864 /TAXON_ID=37098 /ORGANISM="Isochrysis sp, Strain CCMP1244" /LENGTH=169 /DNA_ID=CAMNT_0049426255 /DNA_START=122 /DNA_END=627 /DNA_ORIENTATION=+
MQSLKLTAARSLCVQPKSVETRADHLAVLERGHAPEEKGRDLLAQRSAWPPSLHLHLMHPGAGGDDAATVATQLAAAKLVDRPHLEEQLWPTVEALERVVQVERMRPHRRLVFVRVVTVRLAAGVALQQAKIWASVDGPLAEEAVPLEAVPAEQLPDHVKLRHSAVVLS